MKKRLRLAPGMQFRDWTVIVGPKRPYNDAGTQWFCRCVCGAEKWVWGSHLRRGMTTSCGCGKAKRAREFVRKDYSGERFGDLVVTGRAPNQGQRRAWYCDCDCGARGKPVTQASLVTGNTQSCGCQKGKILAQGIAARNEALSQYKQSAKYRNLLWLLSDEEAIRLMTGVCHYCGLAPSYMGRARYAARAGRFLRNGIDRLDSQGAYGVENCVPCCSACNIMKSDKPLSEFLAHVARIYEHSEANGLFISSTCP